MGVGATSRKLCGVMVELRTEIGIEIELGGLELFLVGVVGIGHVLIVRGNRQTVAVHNFAR